MSPPEGLYPVCKPPGMTSHDVVAFLRRLSGERRVGHAGTLDPPAAGVLLVLVGQGSTRLAEYLLGLPKIYVAEVRFGTATDTQDATGRPVARGGTELLARLGATEVEEVLPRFRGTIQQVPPAVSAVRVGGRRLYDLARQGVMVTAPARAVTIHRLELLEFRRATSAGGEALGAGALGSCPVARLRVVCSHGTYVRALAHDLGRVLGVGAHLGFLVREAVGSFRVEEAATVEELASTASAGQLSSLGVPPARAVEHLPAVSPPDSQVARLERGEAIVCADRPPAGARPGDPLRVLDCSGDLVAIATLDGGRLLPRKVLRPGKGDRSS